VTFDTHPPFNLTLCIWVCMMYLVVVFRLAILPWHLVFFVRVPIVVRDTTSSTSRPLFSEAASASSSSSSSPPPPRWRCCWLSPPSRPYSSYCRRCSRMTQTGLYRSGTASYIHGLKTLAAAAQLTSFRRNSTTKYKRTTRLKILPVLTREHSTSLLHWV
jgi:hypothetical protein